MQMDRMFTDDAELDAMLEKSGASHISEMFHKTILEVNENGTVSNVAAGLLNYN
jgi:serine protease inhibitor